VADVNMAMQLVQEGNLPTAERHLRRALASAVEHDDTNIEQETRIRLAALLVEDGRFEEALDQLGALADVHFGDDFALACRHRAVLGSAYVDNSMAGADDFMMSFQDVTTEYFGGYVWTRPGLSKKTRSMLNLAMLAALNRAEGEVGDLFRHFFGDFEFDGITLRVPTRTFDGRLEVEVGGRVLELIEVGPAHTRGDTIVVVPDARTVYTGDILFIGGTPIVWAGPLSNWVAACDLMLAMDVDTVVPGHGPVTDKSGVAAVRDYLAFVDREATARHRAGVDVLDAARDIAREVGTRADFSSWGEFGRIAVNVDTAYRSIDPAHRSVDVIEMFRRMAALEGYTPSH
ncbi:MAG: MBL fold metallo-hydrolase, partial [Ilumatobacteraceae bacterium]